MTKRIRNLDLSNNNFKWIVLLILATLNVCASNFFPPRTRLTWVNGIAHMPEHMSDPTYVISRAFGNVDVDYCFNPSAMTSESDYIGFLKDGVQASTHQMGRITPEVDSLVNHLRAALKQVGKSGKVIHIAHSQGAVITWLAARRLTREEMRRIEVICFGGAATLTTSEFPFARCINYYAINDPILNVVPSAVKVLKSGFSFGDGMEQEIVFLTSRTGDPVTDHGLLNPTYLEAMFWEGRRYQSIYLSPFGHVADSAFVAPFMSTGMLVSKFCEFSFETTKRLVVAVVAFFVWVQEFLRNTISFLLDKDNERYVPIKLS
ncbi:hypothetical protein ACHAXS_004968 [Conticribra weissflogii]